MMMTKYGIAPGPASLAVQPAGDAPENLLVLPIEKPDPSLDLRAGTGVFSHDSRKTKKSLNQKGQISDMEFFLGLQHGPGIRSSSDQPQGDAFLSPVSNRQNRFS